MKLAKRYEGIRALIKLKLRSENLIQDDDIIMPYILLMLEDLDFVQGDAVLLERDTVFQKAKRLQEAVACRIGQRQAALVNERAHLNVVSREQVVKDILVLDGNRLLEDELVKRLYQELIAMKVDKYDSHNILGWFEAVTESSVDGLRIFYRLMLVTLQS